MQDAGGDGDAVVLLPPVPESVRAARNYVEQQCLEAHLAPRLCAEAVLLTGEIVSNVVRHARSEARMRVWADAEHLLVEVGDDDGAAVVAPAEPSNLGGRGLRVVDAIAGSWGVRRCPTGKTVWFELPRR